MASACINISIPPEPFPPPPPYTWQTDITDPDLSPPEFEFFHLDDSPTTILPTADELFSDGKLVPLQISTARSTPPSDTEIKPLAAATEMERVKVDHQVVVDPYAFSPRAPTCSIRWRNILRLKKLQLSKPKFTPSPSSTEGTTNPPARSLTSILNRAGSKLPAPQKDSDSESVSTSSRLSLSSSSSSSSSHDDSIPKQRRAASGSGSASGALAESPRLNSSGKVVFERSSSSPGSFNGGSRYKHGVRIERSYSAHVRVAPVLNVPVVCSIRGSSKFGFPLFQSHKRDVTGVGGSHRVQQLQRRNSKNSSSMHRTDQAAA